MTNQTDSELIARLTGFTPGPWVHYAMDRAIYGGPDEVIVVYPKDLQLSADAALIAAAPDLHRIALERGAEIARLRDALTTARADAIHDAADACTNVIKKYDVMKPDGKTYESLKMQKAAKGMVSLARRDIEALASKP